MSDAMNYAREYDEYWLRTDRWGSHSFHDPNDLASQIERTCGRGSVLDVGCGMGLLVHTLVSRGIDAKGTDVAQRVVDEGNRQLTGRFHTGSILSLPFPDGAFETVCSTDCLEHLAEIDVPHAVHELYRVCRRFAFIRLATTPDREGRWHLTTKGRVWWETSFFEAGFRKHPLLHEMLPYESLEEEDWQITLIFEKIPAAAIARYPMTALKAERDLHMDMLRESGRRSDAHIARYVLAKNYIRPNDVVLDAACGLGYGSAVLAQAGGPSVRVVGFDNSAYAVDYARRNFAACLPNTEFHDGDVCDLSRFADNTVGLVVSFETVEHLREPGVFLREVKRVLKPGGRFACSVPNLWVDETGEDPNPWHFHVFDFPRMAAFCQEQLDLQEVFAQTAGGGMKCNALPRRMRQVNLPYTQSGEDVEWWIAIAGKPVAAPDSLTRLIQGRRAVVMATDPKHPLYQSWLGRCPVPYEVLNPGEPGARVPADALLLITHDTYADPGRSLVRQAVADGVPTLILADGMLEYRNTFEHPQLEVGAVFQPVLGHKIATISQAQTQIIESWGNIGKCETVGLPRLDRYYGLARRQRHKGEPYRILIGTAMTPFFTEGHRRQVLASLFDLKAFFSQTLAFNGTRLEPVWRLTQGLAEVIGVSAVNSHYSGRELAELLLQVDAVITTPSTTMLEAMMLGLPVAVLDYCNAPHYMPTAWRITAVGQITDTVDELLNPAPTKLLFQETMLHHELECFTPATPRLVELISRMAEEAIRASGEKSQPKYSMPLLPTSHPQPVENRFASGVQVSCLEGGSNRSHSTTESAEEPTHEAIPAKTLELASSSRTTQMKEVGKQPLPVVLTDLLDRATASAADGHKVLAEMLLEDALMNFPNNDKALELLQELRTTGSIRKQIVRETPALPVCVGSNHQVGQERMVQETGRDSRSTTSAVNDNPPSGQDSPRPPRRPYQDFFASLNWGPDRMVMSGVEFILQHAVDATGGKRGQGFLFYKTPELVQQYQEYFEKLESFSPGHVFEIGLWDGGSAVFWHECFHPQKHVAIDIQARTDCISLDRYRAESGITGSLVTHWQTDQSDTTRLREIVKGELGNRLDLVIDDASHLYRQTRASFEALFPFLRPGGIYIIEDWAWGHWPSFQAADHPWKDEIPLTRLITELVEIVGGSNALVRSVDVCQGFVAVTRGAAPIERSANLRLEALISRKAVWF